MTGRGLAVALVLLLQGALLQAQPADNPPPVPDQEQPEVLTRGPVHEAFAEPIDVETQSPVVATNPPPADIQEVPPDERPDGDNYEWIPGYWAWDQDRHDYTWVSACWRVSPPSSNWVPGYWSQTTGGWEWIPGFWAPDQTEELEYLPAPPALESIDPVGAAPSEDVIWVPPCWYWQQSSYVLRPGYWLRNNPQWVWAASHNLWTPRGYVFVEGHWDYPLERRGLLFAPCNFPHSVYTRVGFSFSPSTCIDLTLLSDNLFVAPRCSHYYFGDYYDDAYVSIGIFSRFDREHHRGFYDPIYEFDRDRYRRGNPHWEDDQRHEFERRRADKNLRPPRTLRDMDARIARTPEPERKNVQIAQSLKTVVNNKTNVNVKFTQINNNTRQEIAKRSNNVRTLQADRNKWESAPGADKPNPQPAKQPVVQPQQRNQNQPGRGDGANTPTPQRLPAVTPSNNDNKNDKNDDKNAKDNKNDNKDKADSGPDKNDKGPDKNADKGPDKASDKGGDKGPSADRNPPRDQPRSVHVTQPERVKVPDGDRGPSGRSDGNRGAPDKPGNERRSSSGDGQDGRRDGGQRNR